MLTAIDKPVKGGEKKLRRTQEERRAKARADLIDSAINLIVHNGFARTTMADIAKRAGLTRGALQHHFTGRAELVAAIIADVEKQIVDSFGAASSGDASIEARLDLLIDGLSDVSLSAGYMAAMDIWLTSRSDPDLSQLIDDSVARSSVMYRALWRTTFGDNLPHTVVRECRQVMVAVTRGVIMSRLIVGDHRPRSSSDTLRTIKRLLRQRLAPFAVPKPHEETACTRP